MSIPEKCLQDILSTHSELFKPGLGCCTTTTAKLILKDDAQPKYCKPHKLPFALKPIVGAELDHLEIEGVLEKVNHADWATPIAVVIKPSGKVRICSDFKYESLNPVLKTDIHPFLLPEELFHMLNQGCKFSKIELAGAYLQIELDTESQSLVVINTHQGLYRYKHLPFHLDCASAVFQRIVQRVIENIPGTANYLDDFIFTGKTEKEHLANLEATLAKLQECGFRLIMDKCDFFKSEIEYLGHVTDKDGVHPQPAKIYETPFPKNQAQLRLFLIIMTDSLLVGDKMCCDLLHKDAQWCWTTECSQAVKDIKKVFKSPNTLSNYDPKLPLSIACDASQVGIGAILFHTFSDGSEKPIAYASRKLTKAERNYTQIQKEALGIIYGIQEFRQYLLGKKQSQITRPY